MRVRHWMRRFVGALALLALCAGAVPRGQAQDVAKYGAEFLSGGVGGRALGMGGAQVALVQDVNAGYWNAAGLSGLRYPEIAYMHVERFAGIVAFDYGAVAFPVNARSTVGLSFYRSGVDDIPNTLNAWDRERGQPLPDPESRIERFSAADYAFFVSYARRLNDDFTVGITGKLVRRTIGDFAGAWGYSFDVAAQYRLDRFYFGANLQDLSTMLQSWSVNQDAFGDAEETFEAFEMPEGGTFLVLPVARLGSGVVVPFGVDGTALTVGLDMDLAFDGQRAYNLNVGDVALQPRLGTEFSYKGTVALRAGISRVTVSDAYGLNLEPSVGAGLQLKQLSLDYGFGDFGGLSSDLGFTHRLSLQLTLQQPGLARSAEH